MTFHTNALFRRIAALVRAHPLPGLLWFTALVALGTAVDVFGDGDPRIQFVITIPEIFAHFAITGALLRGEELHRAWAMPGRVASYIGLGIVTGLAIMIGLFLLILPGLYLYARWVVATPLVIGEGASMSEAMSRSWRRTRPAATSITAALVLINLPYVAGLFAILYLYPPYGPAPLALALAANALFFASSIGSWYFAVAVHALLAGSDDDRSAPA
ncbi:hypothetical protein BXU08_14890 [Sphingomonas sp. LM7]|nr:hypothetical protein BXU08_14890 [Sphingomonas sp. LM7]